MDITSVKVGVGTVHGAVPITVKLHKSTGAFPGSYPAGLTEIGSETKSLTATTTAMTIDVTFTTPVSASAGDIIVVEVNNAETTAGNAFYMGVITGTETGLAYIRAETCDVDNPTLFATVVAGSNGKIVIDIVAQNLSTENFFSENFALYPNPASDVLNISSRNVLTVNEVRVTDLSGKVVLNLREVSTVNVSN